MNLTYRSDKNAESTARFWGKSLDQPDWYKIEAKEDDNAEILIYDVIGWPYNDAADLVRSLSGMQAEKITVRINSPGGDVFDGIAIYNALRDHPAQITTKIESLAASMASVIALAGDEVQAQKNAMYMIHDPWAIVGGNQYDLRETADILQKISVNMIDIYSERSDIGKRELKTLMKAETWFTAKEAHDRGLIDTVLEAGAAKAKFDLSIFANAPEGPKEPTERDKEKALRDAGLSHKEAKAVLAGRKDGARRDVEAVQAVVDRIKTLFK